MASSSSSSGRQAISTTQGSSFRSALAAAVKGEGVGRGGSGGIYGSSGGVGGSGVGGAGGGPIAGVGAGGGGGTKLRVVELDALVLIKVLKHCRDNYPTPVNGQLLGMDTGEKLEVTNCFPLPQKRDVYLAVQKEKQQQQQHTAVGHASAAGTGDGVDEKVEEEFESYQDRMAELMHDVNVDCFTIGWYQTFSFGDLKNKDNIDSLVLYQELVDKAVMLGFDPLLNAMGRMAFKAYRASDEFLSIYHKAEEDCSKYNKLKGKDILVEVPIVVKNPLLLEAFLQTWARGDPAQSEAEFNSLEVDQQNYVEKNLNFLCDCLDELGSEQDKLMRYQRERVRRQQQQKQISERRRLENEQRRLRGEAMIEGEESASALKLDMPSQISTLLMANQASIQCCDINAISSENLAKLYLLGRGNCLSTSGGLTAD
eukprot:GHVS01062399.1.p1 GENE.GHVS01062399.1~~GHVS01062399.1.p1  ORF type:complete len:427 (-),score=104.56 GHVS01062399.1:441-1721(-)